MRPFINVQTKSTTKFGEYFKIFLHIRIKIKIKSTIRCV